MDKLKDKERKRRYYLKNRERILARQKKIDEERYAPTKLVNQIINKNPGNGDKLFEYSGSNEKHAQGNLFNYPQLYF